MIENPFFHRGPIRDAAYFFNRDNEAKRALELLGKGQSVSLTGPRKIGKTSLLFHISRPKVIQQFGLDPARHLVVYFNCERSGHLKLEEFYALILEEIAARAAFVGYDLAVPECPVSHLEFERILREGLEREFKFVLLLDEFELLSRNGNLCTYLLSGLRALATELDVAYLTVSRRPLATFTGNDHSPFFNIFLPQKLGLFEERASRELIEASLEKTGATFTPQTTAYILELGGGHPFFLQVVGYWALELQTTKGAPLDGQDFRILTQTVRGQVESHFAYYWKHLTPGEQYVLAALPFTQGEKIYREQLETLVRLCLIVKDEDRYRYFSPLFRDFVRRQKVDEVLQAGALVLALPQRRALCGEDPLSLTPRQFDLLSYLLEHQGQVVSNEELDREVMTPPDEQHKYEYLGDERLKSAIKGLRVALGDAAEYVVNKRGVGYMLHMPAEE